MLWPLLMTVGMAVLVSLLVLLTASSSFVPLASLLS